MNVSAAQFVTDALRKILDFFFLHSLGLEKKNENSALAVAQSFSVLSTMEQWRMRDFVNRIIMCKTCQTA